MTPAVQQLRNSAEYYLAGDEDAVNQFIQFIYYSFGITTSFHTKRAAQVRAALTE